MKYVRQFKEAIDDDLNIPLALGVLFTLIKEERARISLSGEDGQVLACAFRGEQEGGGCPRRGERLPKRAARRMKDYARADELRKAGHGLGSQGFRDGYELVKL